MKNITISTILLAFTIISCTEEYPVDFGDIPPKLVVECALLDIDSAHFVKLSLSKSSFAHDEFDTTVFGVFNKFKPVSDATVIISDDHGIIDTLIGQPDSIQYSYTYFDPNMGEWITNSGLIENEKSLSKGYYFTNKIKVEAGKTFYLKIKWQGTEYTSSCYTPALPKIDSVTYDYVYNETKNDYYYIPYIWFADNPSTIDFYLFKTNWGSNVWSRAILSDEFFSTEVKGIDVFKGEAIDYWRNAYPPEWAAGLTYRIEMHSITKEIYGYYKGLIGQFRNDGGIYTPSPSSPPTNISNGALGYFRSSCVQVVEDIIPYPPQK
jgi:hypothetical protein